MWNNTAALNRISTGLSVVAIGMLLGALAWRVADLEVFSLRTVEVVGDVKHLTREQVRTTVVRELRGTFFTVDLRGARSAFEELPWVRRVELRRRWPSALEIFVEEHRELARWGKASLVNERGEVFDGTSDRRLPVLTGPDGSNVEVTQNYLRFDEMVSRIGRQVHRVRLSERRAWQLELDDGTLIKLGRYGVADRLDGFVAAYERSVAELKGKVRYVDLRYVNGFAVRVEENKRGDKRV